MRVRRGRQKSKASLRSHRVTEAFSFWLRNLLRMGERKRWVCGQGLEGARPITLTGLDYRVGIVRDTNLQRVEIPGWSRCRLETEQIVIMNLVGDALEALVETFLRGEVDVLAA